MYQRQKGAWHGVTSVQSNAWNSLCSCRLPTSARYISLREDTAPLRVKGTRGAAHFCPDGAHVDPAAPVHRKAFWRARRKGFASFSDRRILRAFDTADGRVDSADGSAGRNFVRFQPTRRRERDHSTK